MPDAVGLYLHIPFCEKKCAYCDFYSAFATEVGLDNYTQALNAEIKKWGALFGRPIDTVYLGGGTPSLLGKRIKPLLKTINESFEVLPEAEITAELNPSSNPYYFLEAAAAAGVNRLSVGVQSGNNIRLKLLGRRHTVSDVSETVSLAKKLGFKNISLDLMLALPDESVSEAVSDAEFILGLSPQHISAYMLKIEPGTRLFSEKLTAADNETSAEQYLKICKLFSDAGYRHYEISNFALPGFESRHNLKYWQCMEYIGIGPSAHSFINGKRFYYPRDLKSFQNNPTVTQDSFGGDETERIMLALRLDTGFDFSGHPELHGFLSALADNGLASLSDYNFSLTPEGMLVSNEIITEILERIL